jgi:amidophosphoribosyltransferase
MFNKFPVAGKKVVSVVSGGNIDVTILSRIIKRGLMKSGRVSNLLIELIDKPGQLERVSRIIAQQGGNVTRVHHEHTSEGSDINGCYLRIEMETRDFEHIRQIRSELERGGSIFQSNSNAELMAYVIATERIHTDNLEDAVLCAMKRLRGAYSTVICAPTRLIGFRDIHGFRPLCVGKLKDSYIITSESCVIETLGGELLRNVEPGEMVVIDKDGFHSYMAEEKAKNTSLCVFEYVYVARPDSVIDGVSVFNARRKAGELLFKEYPIEADMVCGVPDSGIIAAEGYASASGIPYGMGFMKNKFLGRNAGTGMDKKKRLLHTKLTALKSNVAGKRIVVIDDSIVRGQTSQHIVNLLRSAGAKEIHMLVSSPPFVFPCHFGIDISDEKSLIANRMTVDEIRREIGADTFGYLSIDSLRKPAEGCHIGLCDGCFTKQFDAEVPTTFFVDKYATKIHK